MPYEKKISRAEPGLIVAVLDNSGSMAETLPGTSDEKYKWVERYFGLILKELLARSTELRGSTAVVKSRYYVHVILYGSQSKVWGDEGMDIETAVSKYAEAGNSLGLGGQMGGTDARNALRQAFVHVQAAVAEERFKNSFPPMVFHLTDGMSQTDASDVAQEIKALATADGQALVVNGYIGTQTTLGYKGPEDFPGYVTSDEAGPNTDNVQMFNMSSEVPDCIRENLIQDGIFPQLRDGARLFFDVRTKEMLKHVIQVVGSLGSRADRQVR